MTYVDPVVSLAVGSVFTHPPMKSPCLKQLLQLCATLSLVLIVFISGEAQSKKSGSNHTSICPLGQQPVPEGLTIRSVKIQGRRGVGTIERKLSQELVGQLYTR